MVRVFGWARHATVIVMGAHMPVLSSLARLLLVCIILLFGSEGRLLFACFAAICGHLLCGGWFVVRPCRAPRTAISALYRLLTCPTLSVVLSVWMTGFAMAVLSGSTSLMWRTWSRMTTRRRPARIRSVSSRTRNLLDPVLMFQRKVTCSVRTPSATRWHSSLGSSSEGRLVAD